MSVNNLFVPAFLITSIFSARADLFFKCSCNGLEQMPARTWAFATTQTNVQTNHQSAEDYFKVGVEHNEAKRWDEAVKAFQETIRLQPTHPQAHYKLGVAFYNLDRFQEAVKEFETAISLKKDYADAYYNLGQSLRRVNRLNQAIDAYKQGLRYNRNDADMYFGIALTHDDLEQYEKAISFYKQAIALEPGHALSHLNLGLIYDNSGAHLTAVEEYKKALNAKSDFADAYYNLGIAFANLNRWSESVEAYTNALRFYPYYLQSRPFYARAFANLSSGNGKAAAADARNYLRLKGWSEPEAIYMAVVAHLGYRQAKAATEARDILNEAVRNKRFTSWPYSLIPYLRGELTAQDLMTHAKGEVETAEMKTYLGVDAALSDRRAEAITYLKSIKEKGRNRQYMNEYRLAIAELSRIEKLAAGL